MMKIICRLFLILPVLPFMLVIGLLLLIVTIGEFITNSTEKLSNLIEDASGKVFLPYFKWVNRILK